MYRILPDAEQYSDRKIIMQSSSITPQNSFMWVVSLVMIINKAAVSICLQLYAAAKSDSVRLLTRQPTRLPHPWDSPGKNTGVGYHFLLQCMKVKIESEVTQSYPTLSDPMDCSLPGSSIHGIFQARVLEWGAIAFSIQLYR